MVTLQKIEPRHITVDLGRSEAIMPISEQVPSERYRSNTKMRVLLKSVERTLRGPELIVSRADNTLLRRLFEMEVPEIFTGAVEIEAIAREPGSRSKVAVRARQDGVDPVGSCVGLRGVRIQNIVNELHGEKIDVVEWNKEVPIFIANALSPAQVMKVELNLDDGTAMAVVPDRQLSLAIGREGQNARLAARLTGWKVDIKSDVEYQVEFQERTRLQEEARAAAATIAAAEAEIEEAQAAAAVAAEEVAVEPESAPSDVEVEAEPVPIAAEVDQMAETIVADSVAVEAIADEAIAVGLTEVVEDAVPVAAELQPVDATVTDDVAETELAEPFAEVEVVAEPEAAVEAVEPLPVLEPVSESVQAAEEEQVTSLRDLPEDIWQVRRARVRRPAQSDADAPGRIRFAEDIAGLRGGVTASRRGRRRDDPQAPGGANANARGGGGRRRKVGKRRR